MISYAYLFGYAEAAMKEAKRHLRDGNTKIAARTIEHALMALDQKIHDPVAHPDAHTDTEDVGETNEA